MGQAPSRGDPCWPDRPRPPQPASPSRSPPTRQLGSTHLCPPPSQHLLPHTPLFHPPPPPPPLEPPPSPSPSLPALGRRVSRALSLSLAPPAFAAEPAPIGGFARRPPDARPGNIGPIRTHNRLQRPVTRPARAPAPPSPAQPDPWLSASVALPPWPSPNPRRVSPIQEVAGEDSTHSSRRIHPPTASPRPVPASASHPTLASTRRSSLPVLPHTVGSMHSRPRRSEPPPSPAVQAIPPLPPPQTTRPHRRKLSGLFTPLFGRKKRSSGSTTVAEVSNALPASEPVPEGLACVSPSAPHVPAVPSAKQSPVHRRQSLSTPRPVSASIPGRGRERARRAPSSHASHESTSSSPRRQGVRSPPPAVLDSESDADDEPGWEDLRGALDQPLCLPDPMVTSLASNFLAFPLPASSPPQQATQQESLPAVHLAAATPPAQSASLSASQSQGTTPPTHTGGETLMASVTMSGASGASYGTVNATEDVTASALPKQDQHVCSKDGLSVPKAEKDWPSPPDDRARARAAYEMYVEAIRGPKRRPRASDHGIPGWENSEPPPPRRSGKKASVIASVQPAPSTADAASPLSSSPDLPNLSPGGTQGAATSPHRSYLTTRAGCETKPTGLAPLTLPPGDPLPVVPPHITGLVFPAPSSTGSHSSSDGTVPSFRACFPPKREVDTPMPPKTAITIASPRPKTLPLPLSRSALPRKSGEGQSLAAALGLLASPTFGRSHLDMDDDSSGHTDILFNRALDMTTPPASPEVKSISGSERSAPFAEGAMQASLVALRVLQMSTDDVSHARAFERMMGRPPQAPRSDGRRRAAPYSLDPEDRHERWTSTATRSARSRSGRSQSSRTGRGMHLSPSDALGRRASTSLGTGSLSTAELEEVAALVQVLLSRKRIKRIRKAAAAYTRPPPSLEEEVLLTPSPKPDDDPNSSPPSRTRGDASSLSPPVQRDSSPEHYFLPSWAAAHPTTAPRAHRVSDESAPETGRLADAESGSSADAFNTLVGRFDALAMSSRAPPTRGPRADRPRRTRSRKVKERAGAEHERSRELLSPSAPRVRAKRVEAKSDMSGGCSGSQSRSGRYRVKTAEAPRRRQRVGYEHNDILHWQASFEGPVLAPITGAHDDPTV